ncbi:MAG: serine/threonine-protein phosphatase, partial [Pirellulales bacterium]|nr:serine/threonine-protein phosphatase [Pirellulales bacterium]
CQEPGTLSDLLNHMNQLLVQDTGGERFMTMLLLTIDMDRREMRWASAGHDAPILFEADQPGFIEPDFEGSLPLGLFDEADYQEHLIAPFTPGQIYIISTDGLWDTHNEHHEPFGKERLSEVVRRHAHRSATEISQQIQTELNAFRGVSSQDDDVTYVVVKIE